MKLSPNSSATAAGTEAVIRLNFTGRRPQPFWPTPVRLESTVPAQLLNPPVSGFSEFREFWLVFGDARFFVAAVPGVGGGFSRATGRLLRFVRLARFSAPAAYDSRFRVATSLDRLLELLFAGRIW